MNDRYSRNQVAERLRVTPSSIKNFVKRGELPEPVRIGLKAWWPVEAVDRLAEFGSSQPVRAKRG